jgi:hypothetical protein
MLLNKDTCKSIDLDFLTKKGKQIKVEFGTNVDYLTESILYNYTYRKEINEFKKTLKYKRKPNEIIVFTDSYSFSCGGFFTKAIHIKGAGLMVGFNGNPILANNLFDSGNSNRCLLN